MPFETNLKVQCGKHIPDPATTSRSSVSGGTVACSGHLSGPVTSLCSDNKEQWTHCSLGADFSACSKPGICMCRMGGGLAVVNQTDLWDRAAALNCCRPIYHPGKLLAQATNPQAHWGLEQDYPVVFETVGMLHSGITDAPDIHLSPPGNLLFTQLKVGFSLCCCGGDKMLVPSICTVLPCSALLPSTAGISALISSCHS